MKFSVRIFLLFICTYLVVITAVGVIVTEDTYKRLVSQEINRSVEEERNLYSTLVIYLLNNKMVNKEEVSLANYGPSIIDLFSGESKYLEVFDEELNLIASNSPVQWKGERNELTIALQGQRNFIMRTDDKGIHYLFITDYIEIEDESIVVAMIKDINHLDIHRKEQYQFFIQIGLIGLVVVTIFVGMMSKLLIRPIEQLSETAKSIAQGDYHKRAEITRNDEIGLLAEQFNVMAEEVEHKINQLENESQRQQRFVDNLTHELRTPLTSIIGYAELLQKVEYQPELFAKGLQYIHSEGQRMLSLNKTLMDLTFYREEDVVLEHHSIRDLLQEVKGIISVKAVDKGIQIDIEGEDVYLPIERDLMKSLLINLVDNGIKASEKGTTIILGIEENSTETTICISDQGRGMESKELKKIKEPFYRIDKARSRKDGGLGLGLAICNQIAFTHHATLQFESELGVGTTAKIVFPAEKSVEKR